MLLFKCSFRVYYSINPKALFAMKNPRIELDETGTDICIDAMPIHHKTFEKMDFLLEHRPSLITSLLKIYNDMILDNTAPTNTSHKVASDIINLESMTDEYIWASVDDNIYINNNHPHFENLCTQAKQVSSKITQDLDDKQISPPQDTITANHIQEPNPNKCDSASYGISIFNSKDNKTEFHDTKESADARIDYINSLNTTDMNEVGDFDYGSIQYFALVDDGKLLSLGEHGDLHAANDTSEDVKYSFGYEDNDHIVYSEPQARKLASDFYQLLSDGKESDIGIGRSGDWYPHGSTNESLEHYIKTTMVNDEPFITLNMDQVNDVFQIIDSNLSIQEFLNPDKQDSIPTQTKRKP